MENNGIKYVSALQPGSNHTLCNFWFGQKRGLKRKYPIALMFGVNSLTSMNINELAPQALRLSVKERALLAASLWESIEDPYELKVDLSDDEAIDLAMVREEEIESGKVNPISHNEMMKRLRQ